MRKAPLALLALAACATSAPPQPPDGLALKLRRGDAVESAVWKGSETAVIVCDMWDTHTCKGAARRVAEMAPKMERFLADARGRGCLIVHAPSDVMKFYEGTPGRELAKSAPQATASVPFQWRKLMPEREGPLPIDDRDWCDCAPKCDVEGVKAKGWPWRRQIETLTIKPGDAISDQGQEIYNLMQARGIRNVVLLGVHTNMCVLGRSFGIRQMVLLGKNVALARDLTDCLYDPAKAPYVSHDRGTELLVAHIEKHWCPSFAAAEVLVK
jgi:nicotinamidase-related amidase